MNDSDSTLGADELRRLAGEFELKALRVERLDPKSHLPEIYHAKARRLREEADNIDARIHYHNTRHT